MAVLDKIPLASVLTVLVYLTAIYVVVADKITVDTPESFLKFFGGVAAITVGNATLGYVRNQAGKGVRSK